MTVFLPKQLSRRCARAAFSTTLGAAAGLGALALAFSTQAHAQTVVLKEGPVWSAYQHQGEPAQICFVAAKPGDTLPKNVRRGPIQFYVSAWPKDGVKAEVSVVIGYPFRPGSDVTVQIDGATFTLFTDKDKAFVEDPTKELKLIEAMRKGSQMVVKGRSSRGTLTTDTYSLTGVSAALDAVNTSCNKA
ncbi:MAG: invasion associated locus B family protein [Pseudomonadota bacterium]